jgi:short-subunit dehydrogenase
MSYALITGASSGIGRHYATELARRGYNIIAVSNQPEALATTAEELHAEFGVDVRTMCVDLSYPNSARTMFDECEEQGLEVEVLVCNAGMLLFGTLMRTDAERLQTIIDLHCTTTTLLVRYFGEKMKERGRGKILIMSSSTAWLPYPTISHYSATKSYLKSFASAIWYELHRHGVSVTAVFPGAVDTPFYKLSDKLRRRFVSLGIMMRPEAIARRGVKAMMRGRRRLTPGLFTKLVVVICALLPARVLDLFLRLKPIKELLERV